MKGLNLLEETHWKPLAHLGVDSVYATVNSTIVINTWITLGIILIAVIPVSAILRKKSSIARYLVISFVRYFLDLSQQVLGSFSFNHFAFITTLFCFIFSCNAIAIIPWTEEPTKDINTTLALGLISFFYTQFYAIKVQGIKAYIKEFFTPIFVMFPLHVIGKLATIVSISFRLFGNIFGGAIIAHIYLSSIEGSLLWELLGILTGTNLIITIFFGLFEGFLQAFVFSMLSLTYLSIAINHDEGD